MTSILLVHFSLTAAFCLLGIIFFWHGKTVRAVSCYGLAMVNAAAVAVYALGLHTALAERLAL